MVLMMDKEIKQKLFDISSKHLLTQNKKALSDMDEDCLYRAEDGSKCAIGVLISDEYYEHNFEGLCVRSAPVKRAICLSQKLNTNLVYNKEFEKFLDSLQSIHDEHEVITWPRKIREFAEEYELKYEK